MNSFEFYYPTHIIFGRGEFSRLGNVVSPYGKKILLVKQDGPLEKTGIYERASELMKKAGAEVHILSGVTSNPKLSKIIEGITYAKENNIDVVVAVGGGSAIDAGKAIALGAVYDGDVWDFFTRKETASRNLPVVAVSTISATGAETSCHCVVTNDRPEDSSLWQKWALHDPHVFPETALIDPELLVSVPKGITAAGMADSISHIIEGYFDGVPDNPISDRLGEGIIMTILESDGVLDHLDDVSKRAAISWAATLAMSGLQDCGRSNAGFPAHWIQHAVGAVTDSSHGEGLAVINPAWLEFENRKNPAKFVQFAERVFNIKRPEGTDDVTYGRMGIQALKDRFKSWGLPSTLRELGVKEEMLPEIVEGVMSSPETYVFEREHVMEVLRSCL